MHPILVEAKNLVIDGHEAVSGGMALSLAKRVAELASLRRRGRGESRASRASTGVNIEKEVG